MAHLQCIIESPFRWPVRAAAALRRRVETYQHNRRVALARRLNG